MKKLVLLICVVLPCAIAFAMDSDGNRLQGDTKDFNTYMCGNVKKVTVAEMDDAFAQWDDVALWTNRKGRPLLHMFVISKNLEVIDWLIDHGANPRVEYNNKSAFYHAHDNEAILKVLQKDPVASARQKLNEVTAEQVKVEADKAELLGDLEEIEGELTENDEAYSESQKRVADVQKKEEADHRSYELDEKSHGFVLFSLRNTVRNTVLAALVILGGKLAYDKYVKERSS